MRTVYDMQIRQNHASNLSFVHRTISVNSLWQTTNIATHNTLNLSAVMYARNKTYCIYASIIIQSQSDYCHFARKSKASQCMKYNDDC